MNGKTLVVSKVQTAYYPIGSSHVFSPASIELLPQHRWTLNAEHGYWFYIVSYPMYQFTDSYWRLFYPEG